MKRNWTKEQLAATLLVMPNALEALIFIIPLLDHFFETGNTRFFEDVEFGGEDNVRSVVFEEERENNHVTPQIPGVR